MKIVNSAKTETSQKSLLQYGAIGASLKHTFVICYSECNWECNSGQLSMKMLNFLSASFANMKSRYISWNILAGLKYFVSCVVALIWGESFNRFHFAICHNVEKLSVFICAFSS